ncbi:MAG: acetylxylan esterase [Chloroflexota bacterium]|nr:acetylxylan esterase [Chloroflexota bacterium]
MDDMISDYKCSVSKPDDFDEFWGNVLDEAANIPLNPETVSLPLRSSDELETFEISYDSLDGVRVAAWYCVPRDRQGPLPAVVLMPGYQSDPAIPKEWARMGYAAVTAAPRGKLRSNAQFNPGYPNLLTHNIIDRNTYSYRGFYVDAWRTIDYLLTRDEVDPDRIGVTGSSQGGGLTITTAAMRPEIKAASAGAPYLCGYMDAIALTSSYPYQEINDYLKAHPDSRDDVERTLAYFDGISFADRIQCPIIMNIGLQDNVCPPETGYALHNAIASSDKQLYAYDGHGHEAGRYKHTAITNEFFAKHLQP